MKLPGSSQPRRRRRKEKLPSIDTLISQSKAFLKNKRKARHLEFSTDPVSGHRSCKGTYSAEKRQKQGFESTTSVNLSSAHHQLGICEFITIGISWIFMHNQVSLLAFITFVCLYIVHQIR